MWAHFLSPAHESYVFEIRLISTCMHHFHVIMECLLRASNVITWLQCQVHDAWCQGAWHLADTCSSVQSLLGSRSKAKVLSQKLV